MSDSTIAGAAHVIDADTAPIYRRGGHGAGPLWVTIATQVTLVLAAFLWSAVLTVQIMEAVISTIPTR